MIEKFIILFLALALVAFYREAMAFKRNADKAGAELERWRVGHSEAERWLAEFPDVAAALAHLKAKADGSGGTDISRTREEMRRRRDWSTRFAQPDPHAFTPAERLVADDFGIAYPKPGRAG